MGLDNFPNKYPCKSQGTAVLTERRNQNDEVVIDPDTNEPMTVIDCDATQACGGCPYRNDYEKSGLGDSGRVYGIFGTECWYRGKYGNYLLDELGIGDENNFYGDNEDGTYKSPDSCLNLADEIEEAVYEYCDGDGRIMREGTDIVPELQYAEWYLRWAAKNCDGLAAWY